MIMIFYLSFSLKYQIQWDFIDTSMRIKSILLLIKHKEFVSFRFVFCVFFLKKFILKFSI